MEKTEGKIQADLVMWFWNGYPQYRGLLFHVPNGGARTLIEAQRFKAMGLVPGIPDLVLAVPNKRYPGMFIEVKKPGGKTGHGQLVMHAKLIAQGYLVIVIDDTEIGKTEIIGYLANKP